MTMTILKIGQIWADNDPRISGRLIQIVEISSTYATVITVAEGRHGHYLPTINSRRTRIQRKRFKPTSTGYRLVKDADQ